MSTAGAVELRLADPLADAVNTIIAAMRTVYDPQSSVPPLTGTSTAVRFFAGDGAPLSAWNAHAQGDGCQHPFLWVRVARRYRTEQFPAPAVDASPCPLQRVAAVEVGVGRCAVVETEPEWSDYAREAEISLDDSWRLERLLCYASRKLESADYRIATDTISPYGPEGGVIAWTTTIYVGY